MSASTPKLATATPRPSPQGLPILVSFEKDSAARAMIAATQRFRRATFERMDELPENSDRVLVTASEKLLRENVGRLRSSRLRVIAVASVRFKDPRTDGVVYS